MNRDQKPKSTPRKDALKPSEIAAILSPKEKLHRAIVACLDIGASGRKTLTPEFCASARDELIKLQSDHRALMRAASALCNSLGHWPRGSKSHSAVGVCLADLEALLVDFDPTPE